MNDRTLLTIIASVVVAHFAFGVIYLIIKMGAHRSFLRFLRKIAFFITGFQRFNNEE